MNKLLCVIVIIFVFSACTLPPPKSIGAAINAPIEIHDLQGCSHISPYLGKNFSSIQGIVTWKDDQGFYLQSINPDSADCSSEAIYVFTKQFPEVIPGDAVSVSGKVKEFIADNNLNDQLSTTEIESSSVTILSSENNLPEPIVIGVDGRLPPDKIIEDDNFSKFDPQYDGIDFFESLESMRVEIESAVVVEPENAYHEIYVIPTEMINQNVMSSQGALIANPADVNPERILVVLPDSFKKMLNQGDRFTQPLIGILTYEYGSYEIIETNTPTIQVQKTGVSSRPESLDSDTISIATYNTNNLSRFDDTRINKFASQIYKTLGSPDILLLEEILDDSGSEDDGTTRAALTLKTLTQRIVDFGGPNYSFIDNPPQNNSSGGIAGGNIRTIILYRTDRGISVSTSHIANPANQKTVFENCRIPIVSLFYFRNQAIYVIGVHLVSNLTNTPLFGSAQPLQKPDENKRISQAKWITQLTANIQSKNPGAVVLVAGDFNDTPESITLQTLDSAGFYNIADDLEPNEQYSIIFQGNAYLYDQILLTDPSNNISLSHAGVMHINTFLNEKQQTSDHDPFIANLTIK